MVEAQKRLEATKKVYFTWSLHDTDVRLEGIAVGKEQGMNEKAVASARNLLAMNVLTHEQIAQAVELPLDKIEELAAEMAAVTVSSQS